MNILVTNDDGIQSPGLIALAGALCQTGNVMVVAPAQQQSGVGSCVSLHSGMEINEVEIPVAGVRAYAIGGTPSDCVMLGLRQLAPGHIDVLVSGINLGPNVGRDIPYSGTVMATLQGYYRKIPSIAVSILNLSREENYDFTVAGHFVRSLVNQIQNGKMNLDVILNVNVPNLPRREIKGVRTTRAASTGYVNLSAQKQAGGVKYALELGTGVRDNLEEDTDIWAIHHGYISVTPLHFNITHQAVLPELNVDIEKMAYTFE